MYFAAMIVWTLWKWFTANTRHLRRWKESSIVDIYNIFSSRLVLIWVFVLNTEETYCDSGLLDERELLLLILCSWHDFGFWFSIYTMKLGLRFGIEIKQFIWENVIKCLFCIELFFLDYSFCGWSTNFKTYESQWTLYSCVFFLFDIFVQYSIADFRH